MQDMKNRQNTENLETTMWVYRCEAEVTKAIYQIINFNGSPEILLQYLVIYGITILFFPGEAGEAGVERLVGNKSLNWPLSLIFDIISRS